jgi:ParB family transcriptional regulator, chromosome partitioning protein
MSVIATNPFRCRVWELHDRIEWHISAETCREEIESFEKYGQLVPALGRPLKGDPDYDVELIYGARRLFVARHLNKPLLVELREMSDLEAIVAMDIENRLRTDISPYERGRSFARWLRSGQFRNQDEIAHALRISASQVSRLLKLSRIPSVIVAAFDNPTVICEGWGSDLMDALEDPERRKAVLRAARALTEISPRPSAIEVYRRLIAAAPGRRLRVRTRDEVVTGTSHEALFRIRRQLRTVALLIQTDRVTPLVLDQIKSAIANILQCNSLHSRALHSHRDNSGPAEPG